VRARAGHEHLPDVLADIAQIDGFGPKHDVSQADGRTSSRVISDSQRRTFRLSAAVFARYPPACTRGLSDEAPSDGDATQREYAFSVYGQIFRSTPLSSPWRHPSSLTAQHCSSVQ
jgi:hypothetical protein